MLSKDVENQPGPVDHLDLHDVLELDQLTGCQFPVADHGVGRLLDDDVTQLARLARPDVRGSVGLVATLDHAVQDLGTSRLGQGGQLAQRVLGICDRARGPHADQYHSLEANLSVLDL